MTTMIAARLHAYGQPMTLDRIEVPEPRPTDVLVEVKACGVVPNLARVVSNFFGKLTPDNKMMPPLPAIFGLDPAGVVAKVGEQVWAVRPGDRVYVNPARSCGSCRMCRSGQTLDCPSWTLQGYFGRSQDIMRAYPYGGLAQFITAPATALVKLPDTMSFEAAARLGYLGTAYAAMKKIDTGPGHSLLINGISGQLGLNAAQLALAMGVTKIFGTGRNQALLDRVRALAPGRIDVLAVTPTPPSPASGGGKGGGSQPDPLVAWIKAATEGHGVDGDDRLPAARRAGKRDDARALLPAARRSCGQCRRGDGNAADQRVLADDQPHRPARLGVVHDRRGRGDGGNGRRRHAGFVDARTPRVAA